MLSLMEHNALHQRQSARVAGTLSDCMYLLGSTLLVLQNIDEFSEWVAYVKPANTPWFILGAIFDRDIRITYFFQSRFNIVYFN